MVEPANIQTFLGMNIHERNFRKFHKDNPHVYDKLVSRARRLTATGRRKIGIGMLFEVLRWEYMVVTSADDFKLNNNYRAFYSRLIMHREPDLAGVFDVREQFARYPFDPSTV